MACSKDGFALHFPSGETGTPRFLAWVNGGLHGLHGLLTARMKDCLFPGEMRLGRHADIAGSSLQAYSR
jgi:hypothetical protein